MNLVSTDFRSELIYGLCVDIHSLGIIYVEENLRSIRLLTNSSELHLYPHQRKGFHWEVPAVCASRLHVIIWLIYDTECINQK